MMTLNQMDNRGGQNNPPRNNPPPPDVCLQLKGFWKNIGIFTKTIMFVNVILYMVEWIFFDENLVHKNLAVCGAPVINGGAFYRIVTSEFTHGNAMHIIFNMLAFLAFGMEGERHYGTMCYAALNVWLMVIS